MSQWVALLILLGVLGFAAGFAAAFVAGQHLHDRDGGRRRRSRG